MIGIDVLDMLPHRQIDGGKARYSCGNKVNHNRAGNLFGFPEQARMCVSCPASSAAPVRLFKWIVASRFMCQPAGLAYHEEPGGDEAAMVSNCR